MKQITINEIVRLLNKEGFKISYSTFWYYIKLDILPKPFTTKKEQGVRGFYPITILEPLRRVLKWRDEGTPLKDLKDKLIGDTVKDIKSFFKKYGFKDVTLPEYFTGTDRDFLSKLSEGIKKNEPEYYKKYKDVPVKIHEEYWCKVMAALVGAAVWASTLEREKIVIEYIIETLEQNWMPGYNAASSVSFWYTCELEDEFAETLKLLKKVLKLNPKLTPAEKRAFSKDTKNRHQFVLRKFNELNNLHFEKIQVGMKKADKLKKVLEKLSKGTK